MKMHLDTTAGAHRISGYGAGYVSVGERRLTRSFVVTPVELIIDWKPQRMEELDEAALDVVAKLRPAIVLLGTGGAQCFPASSLLAPMLAEGIGVEVMTTAAACRTYNILVAEERPVAAAMFVP